MARYIDVEPLEDKLKEHIKKTESELMLGALSTFLRVLDITPTADVVAVVRCKDCVHGTDRTEEFGEGCVNPIACMMYSSDGEPDFFPKDNYCGFGERKDDE